MNSKQYLLLKIADEDLDNNSDTVLTDLKEGYKEAQNIGYIPATALGGIGILSGKGFKDRTTKGLAGVGAGLIGTIASRAVSDKLKRVDNKRKLSEQQFEKILEEN